LDAIAAAHSELSACTAYAVWDRNHPVDDRPDKPGCVRCAGNRKKTSARASGGASTSTGRIAFGSSCARARLLGTRARFVPGGLPLTGAEASDPQPQPADAAAPCVKHPYDIGLFLIERKTDVIAFVALILSLISFMLALAWVFQRPDPVIIPPRGIDLFGMSHPGRDQQTLGLSAVVSYANRGGVDQPWIVLDEQVHFQLEEGGPRLTLTGGGHSVSVAVEDRLIELSEQSRPASPFRIPGGDVVAHPTDFMPERQPAASGDVDRDYLGTYDFVEPLMRRWREATKGQDFDKAAVEIPVVVAFDFCAYGIDGRRIGARCNAELYYMDLFDLAENQARTLHVNTDQSTPVGQGWTSVACYPVRKQPRDACKR
jgi:hypothetical protein